MKRWVSERDHDGLSLLSRRRCTSGSGVAAYGLVVIASLDAGGAASERLVELTTSCTILKKTYNKKNAEKYLIKVINLEIKIKINIYRWFLKLSKY